jgi:hypothetical protein
LRRYLNYVKEMVVDGTTADPAALTDEWRTANDYYHELEQLEVGIAYHVAYRDLAPSFTSLARELEADSSYRHTFDIVPTRLSMVELDKLIVFQPHINRNFIQALVSRLGPSPDPEVLFRFCLPLGRPDAPVQIRRVGSKRYVFHSDSTDFRFHEPILLRPDQIRDYDSFGPIASIVGLVFGFGSNFLNAICVGKRLLLHNGYHRACALRGLGITHAPCIIQTVTRMDELEMIAKAAIVEDPDFYFNTARPPLLKDFFDPKIRKVLQIYPQVKMVEVNFEVKDYVLPK